MLNFNEYQANWKVGRIGKLYQDLLDVFDRDFFHMGNDEISFKCWLKYPDIEEWLAEQNSTDLMELWGIFQETGKII